MKTLSLTAYTYRADLDVDDLRQLTKTFVEAGVGPTVIAQYERLDGKGGFLIQEMAEDPEADYELTLKYSQWLDFEILPVTTMEDAFPVIARLYG